MTIKREWNEKRRASFAAMIGARRSNIFFIPGGRARARKNIVARWVEVEPNILDYFWGHWLESNPR